MHVSRMCVHHVLYTRTKDLEFYEQNEIVARAIAFLRNNNNNSNITR